MNHEQPILQQQIEVLNQQLQQLQSRVTSLEQAISQGNLLKLQEEQKKLPKGAGKPSDKVLNLVGGSKLLPRVSTLCFLLVVALGLRTLTDSSLLDPQIGSLLGIVYATALMFYSFFLYKKASSLAPVFAVVGALLMFSVVVETHTRFHALPSEMVYIILALTGIGMAVISYLNKAGLPIIVGTLGMCLAGVAIDYPTPFFPYMGLLLWIANILGYFATRMKRCSWLRWLLMFTTHFMLQLWGLKLGMVVLRGEEMSQPLAPDWFLPIVALIGFTFMLISMYGIIRTPEGEKVSKFDFSLPPLNAAWCYVTGMYVIHNPVDFGGPTTAAAILHFGFAQWLSYRKKTGAPGTNTFITGGAIMLCFSLPALFGSLLIPLPILSALALGISYYSRQWGSGGMRVSSYVLQAYVSLVLTLTLSGNGVSEEPTIALIVTAICGLIGIIQYRFCRKTPPPATSSYFENIDKHDRSAVFVLLAGLSDGYFMTMVVVYLGLLHYSAGGIGEIYAAIQSVSINGAAAVIMLLALFWRNKELRNVSILVTVLGGAKVFIGDMFSISGLPLLISVFSFGVAAAIESLALGRLQLVESQARKRQQELEQNQEA